MKKKNPAAVELGKRGGKALVERVGAEGMSERGKKGMAARWASATPEEKRAATAKARAARKKKSHK
jgi:hypothetical protein